MEPLVLAIPGSFNTKWGQDVWKEVSSQAHGTSEPPTGPSPAGRQVPATSYPPHPLEGTAVDKFSRSLRYLFETCNHHNYFDSEEARHRRMRTCVEAAALLICRIGYRLDWFGDVDHIRYIRILSNDQLQVLAGYAANGLVHLQSEHGQPDKMGRESTHRIDELLKTAWECVEDLRRAFEPWTQKRTREQVEEILRNHDRQISELERIKVEADGMKDVDLRIFLYQDAMDNATHRLTRQLPGVSFDEPHWTESFLISDTFKSSASLTPQFIFPGQQAQALTRLGQRLREVLDGQVTEGYEDVLEGLKSVDHIPTYATAAVLGLPSSFSSSPFDDFYRYLHCTDRITKSLGTQCILLNIICDLIIPSRGIFSDYSCPESITTMLVDVVRDMLQGYVGPDEDIREAVREIESANPDERILDAVREVGDGEPMDRKELQRRALEAFPQLRSNP
ncbi:hypothetical protein EDB85DRAFT_2155674 [Lactarius pseudohatsudake]|nr:hypothetical protein EDB85DRAFT_2155674 [Lactarius pseudohatsudake]